MPITLTSTGVRFNDGNTQVFAVNQTANNAILENGLTINSSYTLTTGKNGMSVGPITLGSGVTVTIPASSRWVIL